VTAARDRVLTAAGHRFARYGFDSTSMRDLALALDIQAPSLYSHFESKEQLLQAVCEPYGRDMAATLKSATALPSLLSIVGLLERWREVLGRHTDAVRIVHGDPAVRDLNVGQLGRVQDMSLQNEMHARAVPLNLTAPLIAAFRSPYLVPDAVVNLEAVQAVGELIIESTRWRAAV
jgi:AcrR family transcriptional regulator